MCACASCQPDLLDRDDPKDRVIEAQALLIRQLGESLDDARVDSRYLASLHDETWRQQLIITAFQELYHAATAYRNAELYLQHCKRNRHRHQLDEAMSVLEKARNRYNEAWYAITPPMAGRERAT